MNDINNVADSASVLVAAQNLKKIQLSAHLIQIQIPESVEEIKQQILEREGRAARESAARGFLYLVLKSNIEVGEFKSFLIDNELPQSRVYEDIRLARCVAALPESQCKELLEIPISRLHQLSSLPADVIEEKLADGTINKAQTTREMLDAIAKLKAENTRVKGILADHQVALANMELKAAGIPAPKEHPEWYSELRAELVYAADSFSGALDVLEAVLREHYHDPHHRNHPLRMSAAGTGFHSLHAPAIRIQQLLEEFSAEYGERITGAIQPEFHLVGVDLEQAERRRKMLLANSDTAASNRKAFAHIQQPTRKVGRPPKIKQLPR